MKATHRSTTSRRTPAGRHPDPEKQKALELAAASEHETGNRRENLQRAAVRRVH